MTEEIKAVIEKNLPAQVGSTLKDVLAQGEKDARELKDLRESYGFAQKRISELEQKLSDYRVLDERNAALDHREAEVDQKIRDQKVFEAELKATAAEARANEMAGFVGMVFRSPVFRRHINEYDHYGSNWVNGQEQKYRSGGGRDETCSIDQY